MLSQADAADIDAKYYLELASVTVLYYDYALTFRTELSLFWSPLRFKWGTVIFFLNRYVTIFGYIPTIVELFLRNPTENIKICHGLTPYHQYMAVAIQSIVIVIMITRTYALWGFSTKVLGFLAGLCVVMLAFAGWTLGTGTSQSNANTIAPGLVGCQFGLSFDRSWHMGVGWVSVVMFDTVIFALTVYKSLKLSHGGHRRVVDVLLRDGAAYFAVMGSTTFANVLTFMVGRSYSRGIATSMTNVLSSVAATRLMLNLRSRGYTSRSPSSTTMTTLHFASAAVVDGAQVSRRLQPVDRTDGGVTEELRTDHDDIELSPSGASDERIEFAI